MIVYKCVDHQVNTFFSIIHKTFSSLCLPNDTCFSGFVTFFFIIINHKVTVLREADMEVRELYHFIGQWNIRFYFFNYKQLEN